MNNYLAALLGGASALALATSVQAAGLPSNGHFASGKGTIGKAGQSLTVKQSSTTGIIDWNSFSVGKRNGVTFDNGSGATLNRVTGGNLSRIAGSLHATGSVYLFNSQGVIVSGTGRIVTGGSFVASSGAIEGDAFSRLRLENAKAAIVNHGSITASHVTLAGGAVRSNGSISAAQVDLQGRDRLAVSGTITAQNRDGSGGTIIATAHKIGIAGSADISASGTHGGTVLIGGDIHGGAIATDNFVANSVADANRTKIAAGARISADGAQGSGGHIVVWSDGRTTFEGAISAKGRTSGGFAEISSHKLLDFAGTIDLTSSAGVKGTLLLDPENVTISNAADSTDSCAAGTCTATGDNSNINVATLEAALLSSNVVVNTGSSGAQAGNITVLDPITWSNDSRLTLDAFHSVVVDAPITITDLGGFIIHTNDGGVGGSFTFGRNGDVTFTDVIAGVTQGFLQINARTYQLVNSVAQLASAVAGDAGGDFAFANDYNAATDGTYSAAPVTLLAGHFEGLGNTISNLTVDDTTSLFTGGLFGSLEGTVHDINLKNLSLTADGAATAGGLVGFNAFGTIKRSSVTGTVSLTGSPDDAVGGLVGLNEGIVAFSRSSADVSESGGGMSAGGLVGSNDGLIDSSRAAGSVTGDGAQSLIGGLVGYGEAGSLIGRSSAAGNASASGDSAAVGGLIGFSDNGTKIGHSSASGDVSATGDVDEIGGLVGASGSYIVGDSYTGTISGEDDAVAGGLIGVQAGQRIRNSTADGTIILSSGVAGGLVGNAGVVAISNSSASGKISFTGIEGSTGGGLVGNAFGSVIVDSFATGNVVGGTAAVSIGGLAGFIDDASFIKDSHASGRVSGQGPVTIGGLVGENDGFIIGSNSTGTVSGATNGFVTQAAVGGFVGFNTGLIRRSTTSDRVIGSGSLPFVGGFVGFNEGAVNSSSATGDVFGAGGADAGGFVGENEFIILDSYSRGAVNGGDLSNTGGFAGSSDGIIARSYSTGAAAGGDGSRVGGFIGANDGLVKQSYSNGDADAGRASLVGGFAGANSGEINQVYSTGTVTGQARDFVGGLIGFDSAPTGNVKNSYWDTDTSGISDRSQGAGNIADDAGIKGKTTAKLQSALPNGFDPTIWAVDPGINGGLPYLIALLSSY